MSDPEKQSTEPSLLLRIWRFPLVAMIVALLLTGVALAVAGALGELIFAEFALASPGTDTQQLQLVVVTVIMVLSVFATYKLAIRRLGAHKHDDLPLAPALRDTVTGFLGGGLLITLCVALAALTGVYAISGWDDASDAVELVFTVAIFAGFVEELLLRGIVFRWLEELAGSWIALALSSLLFGFLHAGNPNASVFSSVAIAVEAGMLLGAAYMLTRSLWLAIGLHAGWNLVQGLVWDVPVSGLETDGMIAAQLDGPPLLAGGGFGLEATVFALVVATGAGIWLLVLARRRGHVVAPMWKRRGAPPLAPQPETQAPEQQAVSPASG